MPAVSYISQLELFHCVQSFCPYTMRTMHAFNRCDITNYTAFMLSVSKHLLSCQAQYFLLRTPPCQDPTAQFLRSKLCPPQRSNQSSLGSWYIKHKMSILHKTTSSCWQLSIHIVACKKCKNQIHQTMLLK